MKWKHLSRERNIGIYYLFKSYNRFLDSIDDIEKVIRV